MSESDIKSGAAFGELKTAWLAQAESDLSAMSETLDGLAAPAACAVASAKQLYGLAHNMKGQAGVFGYTLLSEIADRLCGFIRGQASGLCPEHLGFLRAHHAVLRFVLAKRLEGDGGDTGQAIIAKLDGLSPQ